MERNIICQYNKLTIILEKNGRISSSKITKHIKAKKIIKDKIEKGDIEVEHCPTEMMWSYILNKPKQGKYFHIFRGELMNVPEESETR